MKKLVLAAKRINWRNGSASILLSVFFTLAGLALMMLVMEYGNVYSVDAVSQTRADAIADSTAVYALSYDSTFNRREAYEQSILLTAYNSSERTPLRSEIEVIPDSEGKNTKIEVKAIARGRFFFPGVTGAETFEITNEAAVEAVGNDDSIVVIP
jgi:hypothetical protein